MILDIHLDLLETGFYFASRAQPSFNKLAGDVMRMVVYSERCSTTVDFKASTADTNEFNSFSERERTTDTIKNTTMQLIQSEQI